MKTKLASLIVLSAMMLYSCKKDSASPPSVKPAAGKYSFSNTDWVGTVYTGSYLFAQPSNLHFSADSTVILYALLRLLDGTNLITPDSLIGTISAVDTVSTPGQTTIAVHYAQTQDDHIYTITNNKTLAGGGKLTLSGSLCPTIMPQVKGTSWDTKIMTGGPTDGYHEFPDLASISFGSDSNTSYTRDGKVITYTHSAVDQQVVYAYKQIGPRIYFAGFNETMDKLPTYFGVILPDGKTILADSRANDGYRLPYYAQTIYWYGPPGVTPNMTKLN